MCGTRVSYEIVLVKETMFNSSNYLSTEKGICLPTLSLWFLLISVEGLLRWRDFKAPIDLKGLPFHLDLCRPFAAHW